jgi:exodeoxyribonuclease VII small subunit
VSEELSFEEAYQELEETVLQLEADDLPLEQALALFERGTILAQRCAELLDEAELRVMQLVPAEDGGFDEEPVDLKRQATADL